MGVNPELLKILACPICKSELKLENNILLCMQCNKKYSIIHGIPVLLSDNILHQRHTKKQIRYFKKEFSHNAVYRLYPWQRNYIENKISLCFNTENYKNKFLIDIGTGSGYCSIEFARKGVTVVACDLTLESLLRLKEIRDGLDLSDRIHLVVCSAEELPFTNNIYDFFIANAVLEHLPNDMRSIKEIGRICKINSKGFVVAPIKFRYVWPIFWLGAYIHDKRIGHLKRYSYEDLKNKFEKFDFKITRVFYSGHFLKTFGVIISILLKTQRWDRKFEEWDNKKVNKKYGANNISICLERKAYH